MSIETDNLAEGARLYARYMADEDPSMSSLANVTWCAWLQRNPELRAAAHAVGTKIWTLAHPPTGQPPAWR